MKKTLLSLALFSSLMTLSGCLKGCDKDKKNSETPTEHSTEKKEESKAEKNAEMENLQKADLGRKEESKEVVLENKDELKDKARNRYNSAFMEKRPDEIWLEDRDEELGYGEPRSYQASSRYRYGERNSPFV